MKYELDIYLKPIHIEVDAASEAKAREKGRLKIEWDHNGVVVDQIDVTPIYEKGPPENDEPKFAAPKSWAILREWITTQDAVINENVGTLDYKAFMAQRDSWWQVCQEYEDKSDVRAWLLLHPELIGKRFDFKNKEYKNFYHNIWRHRGMDESAMHGGPEMVSLHVLTPAIMACKVIALGQAAKGMENLDAIVEYGLHLYKASPDWSLLLLRELYVQCSKRENGRVTGDLKLFKGKMREWIGLHKDVLLGQKS